MQFYPIVAVHRPCERNRICPFKIACGDGAYGFDPRNGTGPWLISEVISHDMNTQSSKIRPVFVRKDHTAEESVEPSLSNGNLMRTFYVLLFADIVPVMEEVFLHPP